MMILIRRKPGTTTCRAGIVVVRGRGDHNRPSMKNSSIPSATFSESITDHGVDGCHDEPFRQGHTRGICQGEKNILESCGRAGFDMEVLVVDEAGKPVPAGGIGEMIIRGPGMFAATGASRSHGKAFKGEWFHTEDVCSIDKEGTYGDRPVEGHDHHRRRERLPRRGEKVLHARGVKESCVIGTLIPPGARRSQPLSFFITVGDRPADLSNYCKGKIAGYKVPKVVHIVPSCPARGGQILKRELREQFAS